MVVRMPISTMMVTLTCSKLILNEQAGIFENKVRDLTNKNYLSIKFNGTAGNMFGIGTKVYAFAKE
jgi:hypothetical protein